MDSNKLRRLAGIPIDLSKPENTKATVRTPAKFVTEAAKVPQHRGELAPKTKDNMKARVKHAEAALEALSQAREALMEIPAIDYMEDIPTIIKQLHHMLHGEDGTGGVHHLARHYKHDFDNTVFPEDIEEEKRKQEEDQQATDAGITGNEPDVTAKKKKTNESAEAPAKSDGLGFQKAKVAPEKDNKKPFKLAPNSTPLDKTMVVKPEGAGDVKACPGEAQDKVNPKVNENIDPRAREAAVNSKDLKNRNLKSPFEFQDEDRMNQDPKQFVNHKDRRDYEWEQHLAGSEEEESTGIKPAAKKAADEADVAAKELKKNPFVSQEEEEQTSKKPKWLEKAEKKAEDKKVDEASGGPLFARDAKHPKEGKVTYPSWGDDNKPNNVVSAEDGPSLYYPQGSKSESPSQLATNPYNESQKVNVPAKIKSALKGEADTARKLAETFTMRKDWDNKNFHENLANAFDTLNGFLDKGTVYGIKEAQVFMTSLMSPIMNKIPADVIKFVAAGGTARSLKSYLKDVKEPVTGVVYQQDSDGTR